MNIIGQGTVSVFCITFYQELTWLGGICLPLRRSSKRVPKLYVTLSGVTLPAWQGKRRADTMPSYTYNYDMRLYDIK